MNGGLCLEEGEDMTNPPSREGKRMLEPPLELRLSS